MRKKSAIKIQKRYKLYKQRKFFFSFARKHEEYYSIYPSKEVKEKISIKLYTSLKDNKLYKILPVRFCEYRKKYVFDIPKNKFPSHKKFFRFKFIIDGTVILDPKYKLVRFGEEEYVNEIDFNEFEKKEKLFKEKIKEILNKNNENEKKTINKKHKMNKKPEENKLTENTLKKNKKEINNLNIVTTVVKNTQILSDNDSPINDNRLNTLNYTIQKERKNTTSTESSHDSEKGNKRKRNRSILREKGSREKRLKSISQDKNRIKKVTFGVVKFSY